MSGERGLCQACGGNGVIRLPAGVKECADCNGDGWAAPDVSDIVVAERERLAKMIEQFMWERKPGAERMVLAIAARDIRRGRRLTDTEKLTNLCDAIAEDDPELADHIRSKAGRP